MIQPKKEVVNDLKKIFSHSGENFLYRNFVRRQAQMSLTADGFWDKIVL